MAKKCSKTVRDLLDADFSAFSGLAAEMKKTAATVDNLPEDIEYTVGDLDVLEEVRHQAHFLFLNCTAALETFSGGSKPGQQDT